MALKYRFTPEQASEIEAAYKSAANQVAADHLYMLLLRAKGKPLNDIASEMKVDPATVSRLIQKYNAIGLNELVKQINKYPKPKQNFKLTSDQSAEVEQMYNNSSCAKDCRRLQMILLRAKGMTFKEIANITGYNKSSLMRLTKKYQCEGISSITGKSKRGKRRYAAHKYHFTAEQKAEINATCKTVTNKRVAARLEALRLRCLGENIPDIADKVGLHATSVMIVIRKYHTEGLKAVICPYNKS